MTYIFALRPITDVRLLPQLEALLARQPEWVEREQAPPVWRAPDELKIVPILAQDAKTRRRRMRYRTLGVLMMLLGLLLVIPELVDFQEASVSLTLGVFAFGWGLFTLVGQNRKKPPQEEKPETPAQHLLNDLGGLGRSGAHAIFSEEALALETPDGERVEFAYAAFEAACETRDLLALSDASYVVTLQKSELSWGEWEEFREFLAEKLDVTVVPHEK